MTIARVHDSFKSIASNRCKSKESVLLLFFFFFFPQVLSGQVPHGLGHREVRPLVYRLGMESAGHAQKGLGFRHNVTQGQKRRLGLGNHLKVGGSTNVLSAAQRNIILRGSTIDPCRGASLISCRLEVYSTGLLTGLTRCS